MVWSSEFRNKGMNTGNGDCCCDVEGLDIVVTKYVCHGIFFFLFFLAESLSGRLSLQRTSGK